MPAATQPNTRAIGTTITSYLAALTFQGNPFYTDGTPVYGLTQLEAIKDITDSVANGGRCAEVYGNKDGSQRRGFNGRMWDIQTWYLLSLCGEDTPDNAAQIYDIRDALVQPFQLHATLGAQVSNLFHAQLDEKSMRFLRVFRNGQWLRAHLCELETRQEWTLPIPPGVIS